MATSLQRVARTEPCRGFESLRHSNPPQTRKCSLAIRTSNYRVSCSAKLRLRRNGMHLIEIQQQRLHGFGRRNEAARGTDIRRSAEPPRDGLDGDNKASVSGDKKVEEKQGIEGVEQALAKAFGGPIWFGVLLSFLAIFVGGYVYLIYNYADFRDIPILNGPVGTRN
jgi:hypothetical protein